MAERAHPDLPGFKDKWFGLKKSIYKKNLYHRYAFCNEYIKNKIVLDIPCGTGWGTSLLNGFSHLYGIDIHAASVEYAKKHYQGIDFRIGNMADIPFANDFFDVVLCLEGFEHVPRETGLLFLEESRRVLKRQGLLIMTCPVLNEQGRSTGNPYHLYEYPEQELISILNENFGIVYLERFKGPEGPEYKAVLSNYKDNRYHP